MEVRRLLSVMENHLADGRTWFLGEEYSIVDMACYPWTVTLDKGYGAAEFLGLYQRYPKLNAWMKRMSERPAVKRGMLVCGGPGALKKLSNLRQEQSHEKSKL